MIGEFLSHLDALVHRTPLLIAIDIIDIALVTFLVYRVLTVLRGTRALPMGVGLLLLVGIHAVAQKVGFTTLWTILDSLLTYVVLIIVILFQNDIRRALMGVGRKTFLPGSRSAQETHGIEEVIRAATILAQKRIGALVVFERDAALDEFIEPGVELDCAVTKELLYSIFVPSYENPLHDGAVIVREGRVWQAGAFLPLAVAPKLDRALGTRHRAAIGISEETDAVVVVVSEERGSVSLCFGGNVVRDLEPASLRDALLGVFFGRAPIGPEPAPAAPARISGAMRSRITPNSSIPPTYRVPGDDLDDTSEEVRP